VILKSSILASWGSYSLFTSAAAVMATYGTTPLAVALAGLGAALAWLEAYDRHWTTRVDIGAFNTIIGAFGGPIVVVAAKTEGLDHPSILILASLALGYVAHSALDGAKQGLAARIGKWRRGQ